MSILVFIGLCVLCVIIIPFAAGKLSQVLIEPLIVVGIIACLVFYGMLPSTRVSIEARADLPAAESAKRTAPTQRIFQPSLR